MNQQQQKLIDKLLSTNVNNEIDINDIQSELVLLQPEDTNESNKKNHDYEDNKSIIYIENYKLELTELKTKNPCISCSRNSIYTDSINNYCWIHCQI